jgi:hypothetical protein
MHKISNNYSKYSLSFSKPISEIPNFGQQQISLQQRPIPQQIPMQLFPPIITSTTSMMPKWTKITTASMAIPEAEVKKLFLNI